ncbi:MAG: polymer-forming cytoskeletal protein, partial [Anaerolineales bacterium]|nr:polymer-forming cytoskeletal protein [Anaerolineales bacterium]
SCGELRANVVIVAGAVRGDITAEKVEIRKTGRVWGNVVTTALSTEEGGFLRGQIRMEEKIEFDEKPQTETDSTTSDSEATLESQTGETG